MEGTKKTKLQLLKEDKAPMERRQLLIMAQSCQHDAVAIMAGKVDSKDYDSVKGLVKDITELRDALLEDLVETYN